VSGTDVNSIFAGYGIAPASVSVARLQVPATLMASNGNRVRPSLALTVSNSGAPEPTSSCIEIGRKPAINLFAATSRDALGRRAG
jgi:hypothetical protein